MSDISKLILALAEYHPIDMKRKVGGYHTLVPIDSDVDSVFQPGFKPPSDFPTDTFDQYRKVFWRNQTGRSLSGVQIYGFNVKSSNVVKFALERGPDGVITRDGSDAIRNYQIRPTFLSDGHFTEVTTDNALLIGGSGVLAHGSGQGVWLRQRITGTTAEDASDNFAIGTVVSEVGSTTIKEENIFHTRIPGLTTILRIRIDQYNPMTIIVDFSHSLTTNYYKTAAETLYALYVDNKFVKEFTGEIVKVQMLSIDTISEVDIYAIPHSGFRPHQDPTDPEEGTRLDPTIPGNKIRIRFRAKDSGVFDVEAHHIQWDEGTGTFVTKEIGVINADDASIKSGYKIKSSEMIDPI